MKAIAPEAVESFRPLLPVGYEAGVRAYRLAVAELTPRDLAGHYTQGLEFFHGKFIPHLKQTLETLGGGVWKLDDYVAYAAGTDVDFMAHIIEAVAAQQQVSLYPGDWFGFRVGCTQTANIHWNANGGAELSCLCIPSVRNGHLTDDMLGFLAASPHCLLNLNLFPTLTDDERRAVAQQLDGMMERAVLSISFSRGFGLTASQLGVVLVHRDHPYRRRYHEQWTWYTNFFNAIAARSFMLIDLDAVKEVDDQRRTWVHEWLKGHDLPHTQTGSYYVKSFRAASAVPDYLLPLQRDGVLRLCFKPAIF